MAENQVLSSNSSNSSDAEETCQQYALKMEAKTPACETDKLSALASGGGAAADVSTAELHGECTATAIGLSEGLEMLLQKQRRDLMLELRKLQTGHRPVTSTESRETLEEFFSGGEGGERKTNSRPQSVLSEVQGLSESRPVSSVLRSNAFRRNLEDVIRGTLVRQDRELQQTLRLRTAGFNVGASRPVPVHPSADAFQQHLESLSQLSHSSRTSTGSHPSNGMADVFSPPPPPPPVPQQGQPIHYQQQQPQQFPSMQSFPPSQWRQQQQHMPNPYQQQQSWQQQQQQQQQYSQWQQQQQQQQQQRQQQQQQWQQPQPWQQPVQMQQPWLLQNSAQQANGNINTESYLQQANREEAVFEISNLVQRQLVSSMLNSDFRGTLENTMMAHLQNTEADGQSVANFIQSLPQNHSHRRNDFSHLGIQVPSRGQAAAASSSGTASWAAPELDTLRRQMEEMQTMMRLTFELQLDMQRSIRQEVAAALNGQHGQVPNTQSVQGAMPPSQPASEGNCVICLEKSVDAVLYQCGHMCCCLACGLRLKGMGSHCPMCRAPIRDVIRAYRCQME